MSKKIKKIGIIIIVLLILATASLLIIPAVVGMNYGYDAAQIEHKIREDCNCESVTLVDSDSSSGSTIKNVFSGKTIEKFKLILKNCNYDSWTDLSQDILVILKKENLCDNKHIELAVNNSGKESILIIEDCIIKQ